MLLWRWVPAVPDGIDDAGPAGERAGRPLRARGRPHRWRRHGHVPRASTFLRGGPWRRTTVGLMADLFRAELSLGTVSAAWRGRWPTRTRMSSSKRSCMPMKPADANGATDKGKIKSGPITQRTTSVSGTLPGDPPVSAAPVSSVSSEFEVSLRSIGKGTMDSHPVAQQLLSTARGTSCKGMK